MSTILLGVTGSIAAYKAAELAGSLVKQNHVLHVLMTAHACEFITPLTMQTLSRNPVVTDSFEKISSWNPRHVALAESAELFVIAPASANVLAKLAHGICDDALTSVALACRAPLIIAPAMNTNMWFHPATQANVRILSERGAEFVGPVSGRLACDRDDMGRLAELSDILEKISQKLTVS